MSSRASTIVALTVAVMLLTSTVSGITITAAPTSASTSASPTGTASCSTQVIVYPLSTGVPTEWDGLVAGRASPETSCSDRTWRNHNLGWVLLNRVAQADNPAAVEE
ncbi:hypothetical protein BDQ12DRAFT_670388 [Crucibulum laeve]|uniref:Secreted protein n=1 Tax=Crucibulum laeve TaxID=68775 RepID=A0A5C3LJE1_9AGAR|nr:hypothetical protein BDQ12DRAFT_670388 [Crucibulum laeve]